MLINIVPKHVLLLWKPNKSLRVAFFKGNIRSSWVTQVSKGQPCHALTIQAHSSCPFLKLYMWRVHMSMAKQPHQGHPLHQSWRPPINLSTSFSYASQPKQAEEMQCFKQTLGWPVHGFHCWWEWRLNLDYHNVKSASMHFKYIDRSHQPQSTPLIASVIKSPVFNNDADEKQMQSLSSTFLKLFPTQENGVGLRIDAVTNWGSPFSNQVIMGHSSQRVASRAWQNASCYPLPVQQMSLMLTTWSPTLKGKWAKRLLGSIREMQTNPSS